MPFGRFAPSPTGPLHFGSLVAAVGSYLEARTRHGLWALRIENVDRTREVPGAAELIIRTLAGFGFEWDGPILYQSDRTQRYEAVLDGLLRQGLAFRCSCSRTDIAAAAGLNPGPGTDDLRYPGTCRDGPLHPERPLALRFRTPPGTVSFIDGGQGEVRQDVQADVGDFVIRRRDGFFAYQLAVVVDDADLGVTQVVRGADLLDNTPRQILLQKSLGYPTPDYLHLPLAIDATGAKLSKSAQSVAVDATKAPPGLVSVLEFLRQSPPASLSRASVPEVWSWALANWSPARFRGLKAIPAPPPAR